MGNYQARFLGGKEAERLLPYPVTLNMKVEIGAYRFFINLEWIAESGLKPFSKTADHYLYKLNQDQTGPVIIVNHNDIDPNIRGKDTQIFKNGKVDGKSVPAKERVLNILTAIEQDTSLPPVEIRESVNGPYRFKLHHGSHRLHLSILAGFKSIPAILITWL